MVKVMLLYCVRVALKKRLAIIQMAEIYQDFLQTTFQVFFKPCMNLQQDISIFQRPGANLF